MHLNNFLLKLQINIFDSKEFWFHILGLIDDDRDSWNTSFTRFNSFQLVKKIQVFRLKVKAWNNYEVGTQKENIKKIEKEIKMLEQNLEN